MKKQGLIILVVIVIIALIIAGIFIFSFNKDAKKETERPQQTTGENIEEYTNLQTDEDLFNVIDESLKFLE